MGLHGKVCRLSMAETKPLLMHRLLVSCLALHLLRAAPEEPNLCMAGLLHLAILMQLLNLTTKPPEHTPATHVGGQQCGHQVQATEHAADSTYLQLLQLLPQQRLLSLVLLCLARQLLLCCIQPAAFQPQLALHQHQLISLAAQLLLQLRALSIGSR